MAVANIPTQAASKPATVAPAIANSAFITKLMEEQFDYLNANGWTLVGTDHLGISRWNDPAAGGPEKRVLAYKNKKKDGTEEEIYQLSVPPVPWVYMTHEAVQVQKTRDVGKVNPKSA